MHLCVLFALRGALALLQPAATDSVIWLPLNYEGPFGGPEGGPSWSPDGQQLAFKFFSYAPPQYFDANIEILRRDGTLHHCPIEPLPVPGRAAWSPIGNEIAVNGTSVRVLVPEDCRDVRTIAANGVNPSWSPDGQRIAFESGGSVMTAAAAGGDVQLVMDNAEQPDWSPDGRSIVFVRQGALWTVSVDGTNARRITESAVDGWPAWSPVGHLIAFSRFDSGSEFYSVWVVPESGGEATRLTPVVAHEDRARPAWSRDGSRLAYFVLNLSTSRVGIGILRDFIPNPVQSHTWSGMKRAYR